MPLSRSLPPSRQRQSGLTLVELLIAVTLGLIALAVMIGVFIANSQNYRQNDAITALQDNARFAMDNLSRDLAMAGYWGGVRPPDAARDLLVSSAAAAAVRANDCGPSAAASDSRWLLEPSLPLEFRNHLDAASLASRFRCLTAVQANTDVLMVRRVSGASAIALDQPTATSLSLTAGRYYVKTNQSSGALFRAASASVNLGDPSDCPASDSGVSGGCPPQEQPVQVYAYVPRIYFVHDVSGDIKVPTLCRYVLNDQGTTPRMEQECLAYGVENLQIEWGIDSDGDDLVDRYLAAPTAAELLLARSARIHLLVRASEQRVQSSDALKEYVLADYRSADDATFTTTGVLRRAFTTTVQLKNLVSR
ncbi:hypothetical protein ED208_09940 [Stagnimonas aquatica]|uniref:Prepilin-type N-terminal cleavage/methylation domain-containing protein n=1 Tax=Stagnimonas aquatica TaxID=2689987 RepID=A0A3N0V9J3_9GAMM|nr:PilW family protein [Stagnimonas aquatica]ROH89453.1 hypothetical protein ED208_09940 [Stagnimonas aquatica]